jgi:HSP20 family protein
VGEGGGSTPASDVSWEGLGIGGFFKGLGQLIEAAAKLQERGFEASGQLKGLPGKARAVYGISVGSLAGKPVVESFGNIKHTPAGPVVVEVREPMVDVFDEDGRVLVVAEMPGVSDEDIALEVSGDILSLNADRPDRRYAREILLPARVKAEPVRRAFNNGVLEIVFERM